MGTGEITHGEAAGHKGLPSLARNLEFYQKKKKKQRPGKQISMTLNIFFHAPFQFCMRLHIMGEGL
jgi:hypothetical protein